MGLEDGLLVLLCGGCGLSRDGDAMCASVIEVKVSRRNRPLGSSLGDFEVRRFVKDADQERERVIMTDLKKQSYYRTVAQY